MGRHCHCVFTCIYNSICYNAIFYKVGKKVGAVDYPNDRRVNKKPMPRLGGIAVIAGFLVSAIYLIITMRIENNIDFITDGLGKKLLGFLFGAMVLGITCYIDDVKGISPLVKLAGQLIACDNSSKLWSTHR